MSQRRNKNNPPERHYCAICNAWMGGDRQSIWLHENGKKHQEKAALAVVQKRQDRASQEKQAQALQDSLAAMEAAARQAASNDLGLFAGASTGPAPVVVMPPPPTPSTAPAVPPPSSTSKSEKGQEKKDWFSKKQRREEEKRKKRNKDGDGSDSDDDQADPSSRKKRRIAPDEGHYTYDNKTYLEGTVFGDMLEEDMPLDIWTGNLLASREEKKLPDRQVHWKRGIVAAVRPKPLATKYDERLVVDIAYLREPTDIEETLDRSVPLHRVRIVLGSDDMIPPTLEEARIMAMGGEEIVQDAANIEQEELDEATGLTSWSTVSVKKTTIHQELKEERERLRQKRREEAEKADKVKREADRRKMEEAKVANADDSALGAYDVWSRSKEGYKGVDIHGEAQLEVHELGKKLSDGKTSVGFKKTAFKAKKKKQNRRTTSADDD